MPFCSGHPSLNYGQLKIKYLMEKIYLTFKNYHLASSQLLNSDQLLNDKNEIVFQEE